VIKNALFLFVVLSVVFVLYLPSYMQMQDLRHRNEVFEKRINDLVADNANMAVERDRLMNDPEYFEKVARERMGIIREDEVIYKVLPVGVKKSVPVEETVVKKPAVSTKTTAKAATKKPAAKAKTSTTSTKSTKSTTSTKSSTSKTVTKP